MATDDHQDHAGAHPVSIAPAVAGDETEWRRLWDGYCRFYEVQVPEEVTAGTWARILDPDSPVRALVARDEAGRMVGFCTYILHLGTWSLAPVCYLEDLFTDPGARGRGVGRALIQRLGALARAEGWRQVYWHTAEDNHAARGLYDRLTGGRDRFVRYVLRP